MKWGRKISKSLKEKKEKKNFAGGLIAIYPVVNSMVSQDGIALRWMSPWAEVYCWLKCMNGAKGWSWVIRRDRCRKRALILLQGGKSQRVMGLSRRMLLAFTAAFREDFAYFCPSASAQDRLSSNIHILRMFSQAMAGGELERRKMKSRLLLKLFWYLVQSWGWWFIRQSHLAMFGSTM